VSPSDEQHARGSLPTGDLSLRSSIRTGPSGPFESLKACSDKREAATRYGPADGCLHPQIPRRGKKRPRRPATGKRGPGKSDESSPSGMIGRPISENKFHSHLDYAVVATLKPVVTADIVGDLPKVGSSEGNISA
jgi:hypothetical protein